jgi:4'-phosphopantetheinyl transferase
MSCVETVRLWRIDLDRCSAHDTIGEAMRVLSADELARADRFRLSCHRRRFIACRAALRRILEHTTAEDARALRFGYGPFGQPQLESGLASFSVSHSDGLAVVAVTERCRIGVDLERDRAVADREVLARAVFSEDERKEFEHEGRTSRAFLSGWTRKEALVKATGEGLGGVHAFTVSMGPGAHVRSSSARCGAASDWSLRDVSYSNYVAAIAVRSPRIVVTTCDGGPPTTM